MLRLAVVTVTTFLILAMPGSTAMAKTPPFEMEVSPGSVAPGDTVTVTIRFDTEFPAEDLNGLIGVAPRPPGDATIRPLSNHIEVALPSIGPGVYEGTFTAPDEPGDYLVVPYPTVIGYEGSSAEDQYPDPATVTVNEPSSFDGLALWPMVVAIGVAGLVLVRRRRPRVGAEQPQR